MFLYLVGGYSPNYDYEEEGGCNVENVRTLFARLSPSMA